MRCSWSGRLGGAANSATLLGDRCVDVAQINPYWAASQLSVTLLAESDLQYLAGTPARMQRCVTSCRMMARRILRLAAHESQAVPPLNICKLIGCRLTKTASLASQFQRIVCVREGGSVTI